MFKEFVFLILGFVLLIIGANYFVDGSKNLALSLKVSTFVIGLTIVAFGTSAPELAVSIKSIISNNDDIVLGNVIGSNIMNILLILGFSSLIKPLKVEEEISKKEIPIATLFTLFLGIIIILKRNIPFFVNNFNQLDGFLLLFFFLFFYYFFIFKNQHNDFLDNIYPKYHIFLSFIITLFGISLIIIGSNMVINNACVIAEIQGVSKKLISLTIIAFGTSLPELVTSLIATIKGEDNIAIGNIIGSNLFNIGIVIGLPVFLFGSIKRINYNYIDIFVMIISVLLLHFFVRKKRCLSRKNGIMFLFIFFIYYYFVIISG